LVFDLGLKNETALSQHKVNKFLTILYKITKVKSIKNLLLCSTKVRFIL
jgi:hypothetical protein